MARSWFLRGLVQSHGVNGGCIVLSIESVEFSWIILTEKIRNRLVDLELGDGVGEGGFRAGVTPQAQGDATSAFRNPCR